MFTLGESPTRRVLDSCTDTGAYRQVDLDASPINKEPSTKWIETASGMNEISFLPWVLELFVSDLERSRRFYSTLGFRQRRGGTRFAELVWNETALFLYQPPLPRWAHRAEPEDSPRTNLRIAVPDVDALWLRVRTLGMRVLESIGDKPNGWRDFMIADPDGFGLRFASPMN